MIQHETPYINRGGDLIVRHPIMLEKAEMRCFFMDADEAKLQQICDRLFNDPTNHIFRFRPLSNTVLLAFTQIEDAYSIPDKHQGVMSEIDVAFWIPLVYHRNGELQLTWYMNYVFVDNPYAMASGREIYGFPKTMAQFQIPKKRNGLESYWVESFALDKSNREARYRHMRLLELHRAPSGRQTLPPTRPFKSIQHLFDHLLGSQESRSTRRQLQQRYLKNWRHNNHVPLLFLRQLRNCHDPNKAAFQEILEAPACVAKVRGGGLLPNNYRLHLTPNESFPIAEELGLTSNGHPIKSAFWVKFDFCVGAGQTLWCTH